MLLRIGVSVCSIVFALVMRNLIDAAVSTNMNALRRNSIYVILLTVILYVTHVRSYVIQEDIAVNSLNRIRMHLISLIMGKDYASVQEKHSGQWMNILFSDVRIISEGAGSILAGIAGMVSRLLLAFIALAMLAPFLAGMYAIFGILVFLGVSLFRGRLKRLHKEVQEKEDRLHAFIQEIIENLLIVKVFSSKNYFERRTEVYQNDYAKARFKRRKYRLISVNLFSFAIRLGYLAALIYGAYQLINAKLSYGTLTAILHIVSQVQAPLMNLSGILPRIYEVLASTERIMEIEHLAEDTSAEGGREFKKLKAEHVSFSYGRDAVLEDVSFDIKAGDILALTGQSGGGKSTIFLLLLGIYAPSSGKVGIETEKGTLIPGAGTRSLFAYVPQGNALFTGSIRENVILGNSYDETNYLRALKTAEAFDFVMSLPEKDDTKIGEHGYGLSEGQVQRIAIARALYSGAPVLLLDESTSALDEETEAKVLDNIRLLHDKTVLIVTHRPAALRICSRHVRINSHRITGDIYA